MWDPRGSYADSAATSDKTGVKTARESKVIRSTFSNLHTLQFPRPRRPAPSLSLQSTARRRRRGGPRRCLPTAARASRRRGRTFPRSALEPSQSQRPTDNRRPVAGSRQLLQCKAPFLNLQHCNFPAPRANNGLEWKWKGSGSLINLIRRRGCPEDEPLGEASPADRRLAGAIVGAGSDDSKEEEREQKATGHWPCCCHGSVPLKSRRLKVWAFVNGGHRRPLLNRDAIRGNGRRSELRERAERREDVKYGSSGGTTATA
uniref:Uncharacterized protein n=1 Tax=Oryza meridionalis TaxID=40149 RepID=A0A0E0BWM9_9ORYZ